MSSAKRFKELAGLPDWPLLLTDVAAAAYLSLTPCEFARGVGDGSLPAPCRTPGGRRWARPQLDALYTFAADAGPSQAAADLRAAIAGWTRS